MLIFKTKDWIIYSHTSPAKKNSSRFFKEHKKHLSQRQRLAVKFFYFFSFYYCNIHDVICLNFIKKTFQFLSSLINVNLN